MIDRHLLTLVAVIAAGAACADGSGPLAPPERAGGTIEIGVAAMNFAGVAEAEWSIRVESCVLDDGACTRVADETVFEVVVTSTRFGDSRGSATYVGPCDATTLENLVSVRLLQLEDEDGADLDFQDPGTLSRWVDCDANRDTLVRFDVAVLRPAQQGFLDIAVNFNAIFCSAKYDCSAANLLHRPDGERGRTHVLGFACAGPTHGGSETQMYLDDLVITCANPEASITLSLPPLDGPDGNQGSAGPDPQDPWIFQWATYRGDELLPGIDKRYFNVALGIAPGLPAGCSLRTTGTAEGTAHETLVGKTIPAEVVYPYIEWAIDDLASCAINHPVNEPDSDVRTRYTETTATVGHPFDHQLFRTAPPGMVHVPYGTFWMGCNATLDTQCQANESPQHQVTLSSYYIDQTQVTAEAYALCVAAAACPEPAIGSNRTYGTAGKEQHPVNRVSWYNARTYCEWDGKLAGPQRLCTEAEWEMAARGSCEHNGGLAGCKEAMRVFPWGNAGPAGCHETNWGGCGTGTAGWPGGPGPTTAVASFPAGVSPYGVHDMSGNVWEWTDYDTYDYPEGPVMNPHGPPPIVPPPEPSRVSMRGSGDWVGAAQWMRSSVRTDRDPATSSDQRGIRCCRSR